MCHYRYGKTRRSTRRLAARQTIAVRLPQKGHSTTLALKTAGFFAEADVRYRGAFASRTYTRR